MHHTRNEVHELSLCEAAFAYLVIVGFCENALGPFLVKYQACPASFLCSVVCFETPLFSLEEIPEIPATQYSSPHYYSDEYY